MKLLTPLLLLIATSSFAKNLDILECLKLVNFELSDYTYGDFGFENTDTIVDLKNGYYEVYLPSFEVAICQATKFNNKDGSITLIITGYENDMVCHRYNTKAFLIYEDGKKFVEMGNEELNLSQDLKKFMDNKQLNEVMLKLFDQVKEGYIADEPTLDKLYGELFDFHYILPQKGTTLTVTVTLCDYIPLNEVNIPENDWNIIQNSIPTRTFAYDKKYIRFLDN